MRMRRTIDGFVSMLHAVDEVGAREKELADRADRLERSILEHFNRISGLGEAAAGEADALNERIPIEGGTFLMGAQSESPDLPGYDDDANSDEGPPRTVTLTSCTTGSEFL